MKKRPKRKPSEPPLRSASSPRTRPAAAPARRERAAGDTAAPATQYKVVELSHVDEGALERTLNTWAARGWTLDGVQFAMRESSRRPAMAFVVFTRAGDPAEALGSGAGEGTAAADADAARDRLRRLAEEGGEDAAPDATVPPPGWAPVGAHERLRQLAGEDTDTREGPLENVVMLDLAVAEGEEPLELAREVRPRRRPDADGPGEDP